MTNWERYDDTIDYTEETYLRGSDSQANRVEILHYGIYPYNASYMDARDGRKIPWDSAAYLCRTLWEFPDADPQALDAMAMIAGFNSAAEALLWFAPTIPEEIVAYCRWDGVFKDIATVNQLRPMLYVHWS